MPIWKNAEAMAQMTGTTLTKAYNISAGTIVSTIIALRPDRNSKRNVLAVCNRSISDILVAIFRFSRFKMFVHLILVVVVLVDSLLNIFRDVVDDLPWVLILDTSSECRSRPETCPDDRA